MLMIKQRQDLIDENVAIPFTTRDGKNGFMQLTEWHEAVECHENQYMPLKNLDAIFDSIDLDFKETK